MSQTLITPPTAYPVTRDECKLNSRVTLSAEDSLIDMWIAAAVQDAEHLMQRAIMPQQWQLTLDAFPSDGGNVITLQRPTVTAVNSVKYFDATTGTLTTLDSADYWVATDPWRTRLAPAYGKAWPSARVQMSAVQVLFTCGWATAADVPQLIKAWLWMRVGSYFENRAQWTMGKAIDTNPAIDGLLDRWRVPVV